MGLRGGNLLGVMGKGGAWWGCAGATEQWGKMERADVRVDAWRAGLGRHEVFTTWF